MGVEQFLTGKLRKFSIVDIGFVKAVYFLLGLLVYSIYPTGGDVLARHTVLAAGAWWIYVGLIALLAIKPMTKTVFW